MMKKLCLEFAVRSVRSLSLLVSNQSCWANYFKPTHGTALPILSNISIFLNLYHYSNYSRGSNRKVGTVNFKHNLSDSNLLGLLRLAIATVVECQSVLLRIMRFVDSS